MSRACLALAKRTFLASKWLKTGVFCTLICSLISHCSVLVDPTASYSCKKTGVLFLSFPCVCPEPTLAKVFGFASKLAIKRRFSAAPPLARCRSVCSPSAHPHAFDPRDAALARPSACMRKRASLFFEFFPYGCPEPVLVKRSLLVYKMASPKRSHDLPAPELGGDAISPHLRERSAF